MADQQALVGTDKPDQSKTKIKAGHNAEDKRRRAVSVSLLTACFWHNLHPQQQITEMMSAKSDQLAHINDNKYGLFTHLETENRKQMKSSSDSVSRSGCSTVGPELIKYGCCHSSPACLRTKAHARLKRRKVSNDVRKTSKWPLHKASQGTYCQVSFQRDINGTFRVN